ncbi:YlzJ-like family protein [Virgibacillus xinjiangensis]|uniref:YlzJ-like family protein n=1 Tax=Virgibacillus xinjiangensis TaxID=393090 RepID=A0ABV7CVH9_9BACI
MIHYTPLSEYDIYPQQAEQFTNKHLLSIQGRSVYAERQQDGSYQVLQLLSTNPQDYMDETFSPGSIIG